MFAARTLTSLRSRSKAAGITFGRKPAPHQGVGSPSWCRLPGEIPDVVLQVAGFADLHQGHPWPPALSGVAHPDIGIVREMHADRIEGMEALDRSLVAGIGCAGRPGGG